MEIFCLAQRQLSLVENSLMHMNLAVELYVNATYYAQHPTLKLVYGKSQLVIVGKLFSS